MADRSVIVHPDAWVLAHAVAARLALRLLDVQSERGQATVVLTGGTIANRVYESLRDAPFARAVDWSRVDVWWGDERFLPAGHPDRNETQARRALLDQMPFDPARIHPMPPSDGLDGDNPDAAAERYAAELAGAAGRDPGLPRFDLLLLGVGEDAHVASIFPGYPATHETTRLVAPVTGSPKPPPVRLTLTFPAINTADQVWLVVSGTGKADAVRRARSGAAPVDAPASGVRGVARTRWLLDRDAARDQ